MKANQKKQLRRDYEVKWQYKKKYATKSTKRLVFSYISANSTRYEIQQRFKVQWIFSEIVSMRVIK